MRTPRPVLRASLLLFGSGACSLIYETVWLRELRLVFGASTMASAAVVACFVGGLGAGGLVFGKRADAHPQPLALYAQLEGWIAVSAALTPLLLVVARAAYIAVGGTRALGLVGGTIARLALAAFVFALPTVLMGGTLPAVARAVEQRDDRGRGDLALLYGMNTLGAVTGCMLSTFLLFETFGTRLTLWIACLINALVAVTARSVARGTDRGPGEVRSPDVPPQETGVSEPRERGLAPRGFVLVAAAVAGFAFCLMELVWYRMLGPLLGGTVFTFGLILSVALLGIGLGGIAYGLRPRNAPATIRGFAWTCILESACIAAPYALGDRLAVLAALLRPLGGLSFALQVCGWATVTCIIVLPAAFVSGAQFPLLIGLLGRGEQDVGRHVGWTYAFNTAGAIVGSLAGGFGLLPLLTAPGAWRFVVWILLAVGVVALAFDARRKPAAAIGPALVALAAGLALRVEGPTGAWRHSPIGAGRVNPAWLRTPNEVRAWELDRRGAISWEADGRESSVAIDTADGLAFVVNGKIDGSALGDAGTTIMMGIVGGMLHPLPTSAMVIGLGTGDTAGWLAAIDSITEVDVAELEPAILEVARQSAAANHGALDNPKVHIESGDARELLLTSRRRYDLVSSEPSNPYRAGVASLFTQRFYEGIRTRLLPGGIFLQWLQGYEVDAQTVRAVIATVAAAFPEVELWELKDKDILLVASDKPIDHDVARMRARMQEEPYRSALAFAWRATDIEGFLAHFIASSRFTRKILAEEGNSINTDDRNIVEFGFARSISYGQTNFAIKDVRNAARRRGEHRPVLHNGAIDWDRMDEARVSFYVGASMPPLDYGEPRADRGHRMAALRAYEEGGLRRVVSEWRMQPLEPRDPTELAVLASGLADMGDESAAAYAGALRSFDSCEADAVVARLRLRQGRMEEAASALEALFVGLRTDPWPMRQIIAPSLDDAGQVAVTDAHLASRLYKALREPFALHSLDRTREQTAFAFARLSRDNDCVPALDGFGRYVQWDEDFLRARYECYSSHHDARARAARDDLVELKSLEPPRFDVAAK